MKIAVNLRQFFQGQIGGLENYVRNVVGGIAGLRDTFPDVTIFAQASEVDHVREFAPEARILALPPGADVQAIEQELETGKYEFLFCPLLVLEPLRPGVRSAVMIP